MEVEWFIFKVVWMVFVFSLYYLVCVWWMSLLVWIEMWVGIGWML